MSQSTVKRKRGRPASGGIQTDQRARLVTAALQAFADSGYAGASLRDIATRADCDVGLIRYYFGNKDALWNGVLRDLASQFRDEVDVVLDDEAGPDTPAAAADRLARVIRWYVDLSARYPGLSRLMVAESSHKGARQRAISRVIVQPFYDVMSGLIEAAKAHGVVPDVPTRTLFFLITHGASFPMSIPALTNDLPGPNISKPDSLAEHTESFIRLIIREPNG
jgi:AcrR family transcriptional regulator